MPASPVLSPRLRLLVVIVFALLASGSFYEEHFVGEFAQKAIQWQHPGVGGGDLYSPWFAAKAALHGVDPYSAPVTRQIQIDVYGHPLPAETTWSKFSFIYPAHIILVLAPLTLVPWHILYPLFPWIGFPCVALGTFLWLRLYQPALNLQTQLLVAGLSVISWPAITAWGLQPTIYIAFVLALAALCFHRGADFTAGVFLAIGTVKPHLVLLLIAYLSVIAVRERRFRFLAGFAITLAVLLAASLCLVPDWIPHWIEASRHDAILKPLPIALAGYRVGAVLWVALLAATALRIWKVAMDLRVKEAFIYGVALLLTTTICLIPWTPWMIYNDLLLIPAILLLLPGLLTTRPAGLLYGIAQLGLIASIAVAPVCVVFGLIFGYSIAVALTPALVLYLAPLTILGALLAFDPLRTSVPDLVPVSVA